MGGGSVKERARLTPVSCPFAPLVTEAAADARQASLEAAAVELSAHPHGHTLHKPPGNAGPSAGVRHSAKGVLSEGRALAAPSMRFHYCSCLGARQHQGMLYLVLFLWVQALLAPKSVYTLPGLWHGSTSFAGFGDGSGLLEGKDGAEIREELSERVRNLGEACDLLQGFQMLVDDLSGFGGIATHLAEEVRINWERKQ
eukprot:1161833-Pelagomonas_calceolata.AAC.8